MAWVVVAAGPMLAFCPSVLGRDETGPLVDGAPPVEKQIFFGRDIRPILSDRCFICHGADEKRRTSGLRLDSFESATEAREDGFAIVPGNPGGSLLWSRIRSSDADEVMPPPDSNKRALNDEERELIRRWIEQGASFEPHWAFVPPQEPPLPEVKKLAWCRSAIDRFILAPLEAVNLAAGDPADRETLLRRVFLDLTGLPPTPQEIDAFLTDSRPDAYERWVGRLLEEEPYQSRFAERMALPWLDQARYADTNGIHMDAGRQIWPWRDWVLRAFRDNKPFDVFTTEQIAGDLLESPTLDQKVASGFNRNLMSCDEGGAINEEWLFEYAVDRVNTTSAVFLGLTMNCCQCHDHKYDPLTMREFYSMFAYFNSIDEPGLYSQSPDPYRAMEPYIEVPAPEVEPKLKVVTADLQAAEAERDSIGAAADEIQSWLGERHREWGIRWDRGKVIAATSSGGASLAPQEDGSVLLSGQNPPLDDHSITLRTDAVGSRLVLLEALPDPSHAGGRVGRSSNGNAVLTHFEVEAASVRNRKQHRPVRFVWAFADFNQENGEFHVLNLLDGRGEGWAVRAYDDAGNGGRTAVFLAEEPFGFEGGTELRITLRYQSRYAQHVFGRVRLSTAALSESAVDVLPLALGDWHELGPFAANDHDQAFATIFGPEQDIRIDVGRDFGHGGLRWVRKFYPDAEVHRTQNAQNSAYYVARHVHVPTARKVDLSIGSDDGMKVFLDGQEVYSNPEFLGDLADQKKTALDLTAGMHTLCLKVSNSGGPGGFYHRVVARPGELYGDLVAALLPQDSRDGGMRLKERFAQSWKLAFSPGYLRAVERVKDLKTALAELRSRVPLTMVMKELQEPRPAYIHIRGAYNRADTTRKVERDVPRSLGGLPAGAPPDRRGLAQWLVSDQNPLVARVIVNRFWEMLFGTGIVKTSEDFGFQSDWPSHRELLDWLAVAFRDGGYRDGVGPWNVKAMLREIVTSSTYRQSSRRRAEAAMIDPQNRLLAYFPRKRLPAESIRDQALYVSGLLVEKLGGPSVKPYQPEGLWEAVAMRESNTRLYQRGDGEALWRRSLYTYWKRACPPPSMQTFDAPTRETCIVRRMTTNTPLQVLTLWNDVQFVEAARVLAQRTLGEAGEDGARATTMFRRVTGRRPQGEELHLLLGVLGDFRDRFKEAPQDATRLLSQGDADRDDSDPAELAAWTMVAQALLSLDETIVKG